MAKQPKPIILSATVEDGILRIPSATRRQLGAALKHWKDGPIEIELRPIPTTRSARANRYYWGVVLKMMAEEMQQPAVDVHELMKLQHNSKLAISASGEELRIARSTASLSIEEFSSYLERVMLTASEYLGIVFPEPTKAEEWREAATA